MSIRMIFLIAIIGGRVHGACAMETDISCLPLQCSESSVPIFVQPMARINLDALEKVLQRLFNYNETLHKKIYSAAVYGLSFRKKDLLESFLSDDEIELLAKVLSKKKKEGSYFKPQCDKLVAYYCTMEWLKKTIIYMYKCEPLAFTALVQAIEESICIKNMVLGILLKIMPVDLSATCLVEKKLNYYIAQPYKDDIYAFIKERYPEACASKES